MASVRIALVQVMADRHNAMPVTSAINTPRIDAENENIKYAKNANPSHAAAMPDPVCKPLISIQRQTVAGKTSSDVVLIVQRISTLVDAANSRTVAPAAVCARMQFLRQQVERNDRQRRQKNDDASGQAGKVQRASIFSRIRLPGG